MKDTKIDANFLSKIGNFISAEGSTLSMIGAILGLGGAIYAAFKASKDIATAHDDYVKDEAKIEKSDLSVDEKASEKKRIKTMRNMNYIMAYKWVILCGGSSLGLMILSKYIDGIAITGLTALAASNQDKLKKLGEQAKKLVGEEKFQEIENASIEERFLSNFTSKDGEAVGFRIPFAHKGLVWGETQEGLIFQMDQDELEAGLKWAKDFVRGGRELSKEKYFSHLGLPYDCKNKYEYWGPENPFDAYIGERNIAGMTLKTIEYKNLPRLRRKTA